MSISNATAVEYLRARVSDAIHDCESAATVMSWVDALVAELDVDRKRVS